MKRPYVLALSLVFCFLLPGQAQQPSPTPPSSQNNEQKPGQDVDQDVVKINTNLVQVDAVVTRNGKQVIDLQASDFEIFEDGKPRTITNFSYISNVVEAAPAIAEEKPAGTVPPARVRPDETRRTIALVVDDLGMTYQSIDRVRTQLRKFINEQLAPNDLVAILRTSSEIGALQQFTTDHRMLLSAIDHIKWQFCSRAGHDAFGGNDRTCSFDAYYASLNAMRYIATGMGRLPGRKSMVIFSDMMPEDQQEAGLSPNSPAAAAPSAGARAAPVIIPKVSTGGTTGTVSNDVTNVRTSFENQIKNIAEMAIRGSVVIYTVDTQGLVDTFATADVGFRGEAGQVGQKIGQMSRSRSETAFVNRLGGALMARETGGLNIHNSNDFGLKRVYDDQQGYYLIGFRPGEETFDRKFHHISVQVKKSGMAVRSRTGFFGVTDEEARASLRKPPTTMNEALMSPFGANQITVSLNSLFTNATSGNLLRASIYVDAADLLFKDGSDGAHDAIFDVDSVLFGDNGRVAYVRSQTATLHLNAQQYARVLREGVSYGFDVPLAEKGASQFRIAVRDRTSGHMGTASQILMVPDLTKDLLALSSILLMPDAGQSTAAADQSVPALRRFHQGDTLVFAYVIYKAKFGAGNRPQLTTQTRVFRDGKLMYKGTATPLDTSSQPDLLRITGGSRIRLGADFPVGDYVLQVVVTDNLAKPKQREATQWIDFEVVK